MKRFLLIIFSLLVCFWTGGCVEKEPDIFGNGASDSNQENLIPPSDLDESLGDKDVSEKEDSSGGGTSSEIEDDSSSEKEPPKKEEDEWTFIY